MDWKEGAKLVLGPSIPRYSTTLAMDNIVSLDFRNLASSRVLCCCLCAVEETRRNGPIIALDKRKGSATNIWPVHSRGGIYNLRVGDGRACKTRVFLSIVWIVQVFSIESPSHSRISDQHVWYQATVARGLWASRHPLHGQGHYGTLFGQYQGKMELS